MNVLDPYTSTALTVIGTILVVTVIRLLFRKTVESSKRWPYQRQLLVFLVVLIGIFLSIAFLPIENTVKNQILSVLGILLSAIIALSSTTMVSNIMAGLMLRVTGQFRGGDFIEVGTLVGRVTDLGIFHTEIQLIDRDVVMLPNLSLVQQAVHVTRRDGTFINLAVSIGYTVSRGEVEEALLEASKQCGLTDGFVFIEAFHDHAISYRLYGFLKASSERLSKLSELHKRVLDVFCERGIEIASPVLNDRREFERESKYLPKNQKAKGTPTKETIAEDVAFDKADEAQSIEDLKQRLVQYTKLFEEASKETKEHLEMQIRRLEAEIAEREEKRKEQP
ncbi:MAG: mechanosensitive ion channel family protein [Sphaerochaetaceae bacterium]